MIVSFVRVRKQGRKHLLLSPLLTLLSFPSPPSPPPLTPQPSMVRQSFEPSEIRKSGPLQPSLDDRTFSGLGAGPSGQGPVKIDIFAQRFALETAGGAAAGAPLSDLVAPDSGRGHLALLQDPLSGARENRTPKVNYFYYT